MMAISNDFHAAKAFGRSSEVEVSTGKIKGLRQAFEVVWSRGIS